MATSETAGDGEAARAERDETTMLRELSVRARGDETTSRERCVVDREPTVLVVDDCSMNLRIVSKVLGAIFSDVRVEFAHDGREGIKRFEELRNDASCELALIIVDYNMPCCDGVTASKYMRALEERRNGRAREQSDVAALWQRVPIVMYTTELHVILPALVDGTIDDRQGDEEPRANGAKSLRGLDGEIIVLGSSSAEVSTDHNRGLLKRLSKSFNKFFKSKSSTLTVRAKLKEDKRAALSKKFEAKGASSFHTSMDNAFPRYSM
jgi:CheY-like chemotaxis protein